MPSNSIPVLSICIPTYNRGSLLFHCLKSLTEQDAFQYTDEVEIVVSDNASEDWTGRIVDFFIRQYPDKIRYHCNETNIRDRNFEKVLSLGRGRFLKLVNDTFLFKKNGLEEMLEAVKEHQNTCPILFFSNRDSDERFIECSSFDEFIKHASYFTTWNGAFGIWREHFESLEDFSHYAERQLAQTEVLLMSISEKKHAVIINSAFCDVQHVWNKGGYNIAEVFGNNYLSLLKRYVDTGEITTATYAKEKKKLLKNHILYYYYSREHKFIKNGIWKHLKHFYWKDLYAYFYILRCNIKHIFKNIKELFAKNKPYEKFWRKANTHNQTHADITFPGNEVVVGRNSYGSLNIHIFNPSHENVIIGNFVSIAENVHILGGGEHFYKGASTYPFKTLLYEEGPEALSKGPVIIDDDVWIGYGSTILSGVTIGKGAIIAAGSVVVNDVDPYSIVGGNPAKFIKYRCSEEQRKKYSNIKFIFLDDDDLKRMKESVYPNTKE